MAEINGKRIKELRQEFDINQDDLAVRIGVSRQAILSYESGKRNPEIATLKALAHELACSVDYLLGISDNRQNSINSDCREEFDEAMKKHSAEHQEIAFGIFAKILNSTADYHTSPYRDKLFRETMQAVESRADHNCYGQTKIESLQEKAEITANEKAEIDIYLNLLGRIVIQCEMNANDTVSASIASFFPAAYDVSKRLHGSRVSDLDLGDVTDFLQEKGIIKPNKWGSHVGTKKSRNNKKEMDNSDDTEE